MYNARYKTDVYAQKQKRHSLAPTPSKQGNSNGILSGFLKRKDCAVKNPM